MPTSHRTRAGGWALCAAPDLCELRFHFPDTTPAELALLPERALWDLLAVMDPPEVDPQDGTLRWKVAHGTAGTVVHRDYDLPALIGPSGLAIWYRYGEMHRTGGPAVFNAGVLEMWLQHGIPHRENGPATITAEGPQWFRFGSEYRPTEAQRDPANWLTVEPAGLVHRRQDGAWAYCHSADACQLLFHFPDTTPDAMADLPLHLLLPLLEVMDPPTRVDMAGTRVWATEGVPHRDYDLPAVIRPNGTMTWHARGALDRAHDLPAVVNANGVNRRKWYRDGDLHRAGGQPAIIHPDGSREYWENGELIGKEGC